MADMTNNMVPSSSCTDKRRGPGENGRGAGGGRSGRGRGGGRTARGGRGRPPAGEPNGDLTPQQLRQRRHRILQDKMDEANEERKWHEVAEKGKQRRNYYMTKLYMVVVTAFLATLAAALNYTRPAFLYNRPQPLPPMFLATLYPRDVIMERDLPRFFQTYSIATANNKHARQAAIHVANSRSALKHHTGRLKVILKAWDTTIVDLLLERNVCGRQFEIAYRSSSKERQDDLLMWCLLTTEIVEGFFMESVQMLNNAFISAKQRGMIVRKAGTKGQFSNAYYLRPRLPTVGQDSVDASSMTAPLPAVMLSWLLEHPEEKIGGDPSTTLQEVLYEQLTSEEDYRQRYMILDEVCQETRPKRALAVQCSDNEAMEECCYFVVPDSEGGRIDRDADEEEEVLGRRRSLREGLKDSNDGGSSM